VPPRRAGSLPAPVTGAGALCALSSVTPGPYPPKSPPHPPAPPTLGEVGTGGRISALWRYPVKSLQGEPIGTATVGRSGIVGDRGWGVRDITTGAVLSAKREPRLLLAGAATGGEGVTVTVPGHAPAVGADVEGLLSTWLGRPVHLHAAAGEFAFVDEAHLHLLAAEELTSWDARRFRPNVVVSGVASLDDLIGERLRLGSVVVEVDKRTKRCAMPTMAQPGMTKDVGVLRTLARERDLRLGVYARVVSPGRLDVGAAITIA
jgi:uncharacterized protein